MLIQHSLESISSCLFGVNGSQLTVNGKTNISLQSNQFNFPICTIVVDDLAEEAINFWGSIFWKSIVGP